MIDFETNFVVMPTDTNFNKPPCIFGGKMLSEMDKCAALTARKLYRGKGPTDAVTVSVKTDFHLPAYVGDLVHLRGIVMKVGTKSIDIEVRCYREDQETGQNVYMANGEFRFVTRKDGVPVAHGITNESIS